MMRRYLIYGLLLILAPQLRSQDVAISIDAPESVGTGVGFKIIYSVNAANGKFQAPAFDESFSVSGPSYSSSRGTRWINGKYASEATTTYVYYITAGKEGEFTIPPAQYLMRDKTVSSATINIKVSGTGTAPSTPKTTVGAAVRNNSQKVESSGEDVFIRIVTNTKNVYVGQPVEATLKLYTRVRIGNPGTGVAYPDLKGFLKENLKTPELSKLTPEEVNGVSYYTGIVEKFLLYPQISGDLVIDKAQMQILVEQKNDDFDDFFGGSFFSTTMTVPKVLSTIPVTIKVTPLPTPQPFDFCGAVGKFEISSSISKESIQANDAISYTFNLQGTGNINTAGAPAFDVPASIEKYDPKVTSDVNGISGIKSFEYILIPRNSGEFVIPEVTYSYFDVSSGRYVTLKTESHIISVTKGSGEEENATTPLMTTTKEDVKYIGQDIRFIRTDNQKVKMKSKPLVENTSYYLFYLLVFVLAVVIFITLQQLRKRNADINLSRNRKAANMARKRLRKAAECLKNKQYDVMNEELTRSLWGYMSDKLTIPMSDLTRENCFRMLADKEVSSDLISELDSILSACEFSRYAPSSASDSPEVLFKRTEKLISSLENIL